MLEACSAKTEKRLSIQISPIEQINYNNYLYDTHLDYLSSQIAWKKPSALNSAVNIFDANGEMVTISGISSPFQLMNDQIIHLKNGTLRSCAIDSKDEQILAKDVSQFIAMPHAVVYTSLDSDYHMNLFWYNWESGAIQHLHEDIVTFHVQNDVVYILDQNDYLLRLEEDLSWTRLTKISADHFPIHFLAVGDYVVYESSNIIKFVNIYTGESEYVRFVEDGYVNNAYVMNGDDKQLFVSFQATTTNGSLIFDKENESNGLWRIDPQSKEKNKLCGETFEELYLYEGNQLFGIKNNALYQIDVDSGNVTQVSE